MQDCFGAVSVMTVLLELVFHTHWPLYGLTTLVLLLPPFLGTDPGLLPVFLLLGFQIAFWAINGWQKGKRNHFFSEGETPDGRKKRVAAAAAFCCVFLISLLAAEWNAERLFQLVYQGEGLVQRTVKQISGSAAHPNGGTVNRGNLYPAGTRQLEVQTSQKPTETIYLKGFTGGSYHDGEWEAADDETLFSQMEEHSLHWGQWSNWIPGMYRSMYFVMNANTMREKPLEARQMWIQQREDAGLQSYTPYFSMENRRRWEEETWEDGERYLYYEMGEMNIAWDNIPASFAGVRDWYYETQEAYEKEMREPYTAVEKDSLPRPGTVMPGESGRSSGTGHCVHSVRFPGTGSLHPHARAVSADDGSGGVFSV